MAVFKHCMSLSLAFLAVAATVLLLAGNAAATVADLCKETDSFPELCKSVIKGTTDPKKATELAIKALIVKTEHVKEAAKKLGKSEELGVCDEMIDDAIDNLNGALQFLKSNDERSLNDYLSAVLTDIVTCDDAYEESGKTSPLAKTTETAKKMASNCLALASQIH
ncbi:hypothetical protein LWI29_025927 [Acer saccharum]|uniref:Pectinesterase inhibitor domain-containing protein n=1 Tax=Acer saccharum TaxID=4024 RepID=A0AA39RIL7_ACESA|nr:hypothetical protein LWI29_025927 [Acer saccharum]KAK1553068.1 hypothetical protein Q3G72_028257 [Acer saccharum]